MESSDNISTAVTVSDSIVSSQKAESVASGYPSTQSSSLAESTSTQLTSSTSSNNVSQPEYRHKKLLKKSLPEDRGMQQQHKNELQTQQQQNSTVNHIIENVLQPSSVDDKDDESMMDQHSSQQPVKLVISKKKGSIFKSRALVKDEEINKKRHVYKHKWDNDNSAKDENYELDENMDGDDHKKEKPSERTASKTSNNNNAYYEDFDDGEGSGLSRVQKNTKTSDFDMGMDDEFYEKTSLRCDRKAKPYYTVVRNVKNAHQIQEIGEFQDMDDDVEYILSNLKQENQMSTRCLSTLQLASKCMSPSFRMHVKAHGIVTKFFKALEDAPSDPSLGLCTAMVMFVLSQDTLNMDLDRDSLELMLNLLECDTSHKSALKDNATYKQQQEKKMKVREMCEEIQSQGKSIHLNLDNITVGQLAMETLLSLTSKRAGEWFKEELRTLGGIEHILKTVCECFNQVNGCQREWTENLLEMLGKIERCLRVLENVTQLNEENQKYILYYRNQTFLKTLVNLFKLLDQEMTFYPTTDKTPKDHVGVSIREVLVPLLKVLINLTHPFNDKGEFLLNILTCLS